MKKENTCLTRIRSNELVPRAWLTQKNLFTGRFTYRLVSKVENGYIIDLRAFPELPVAFLSRICLPCELTFKQIPSQYSSYVSICDPNHYEVEEVTAPLLIPAENFGEYFLSSDTYTGEAPTEETIIHANILYENINAFLEEQRKREAYQQQVDNFTKLFELESFGMPAGVLEEYHPDFFVFTDQSRYLYFRFPKTDLYLVVDTSKLPTTLQYDLKLVVPPYHIGAVIGYGGCNIKSACEYLRSQGFPIGRIHVVDCEDFIDSAH